jgi:hypothetical protein
MITCGGDRKIKVWDLRNFREISELRMQLTEAPSKLSISQRGVFAFSSSNSVHVKKNKQIKNKKIK